MAMAEEGIPMVNVSSPQQEIKIEELILIQRSGNGSEAPSSVSSEVLRARPFAVYFCTDVDEHFTNKLVEYYNRHKDDFEIVFVSLDASAQTFESLYGKMPWLAIPHSEVRLRSHLATTLFSKVSSTPALLLFQGNGKLMTEHGTHIVSSETFTWFKKAKEDDKEQEKLKRAAQRERPSLIRALRLPPFRVPFFDEKDHFIDPARLIQKLIFSFNKFGLCGVQIRGHECKKTDWLEGSWDFAEELTTGPKHIRHPRGVSELTWTLFRGEFIVKMNYFLERVEDTNHSVVVGVKMSTNLHRTRQFGREKKKSVENKLPPGSFIVGFHGNFLHNNIEELGVIAMGGMDGIEIDMDEGSLPENLDEASWIALNRFRHHQVVCPRFFSEDPARLEKQLKDAFGLVDEDRSGDLEYVEFAMAFSILFNLFFQSDQYCVPSQDRFGSTRLTLEEFAYLFGFLHDHRRQESVKERSFNAAGLCGGGRSEEDVPLPREYINVITDLIEEIQKQSQEQERSSCQFYSRKACGVVKRLFSMALAPSRALFSEVPLPVLGIICCFIPVILAVLLCVPHIPLIYACIFGSFQLRGWLSREFTIFEAVVPLVYEALAGIFQFYQKDRQLVSLDGDAQAELKNLLFGHNTMAIWMTKKNFLGSEQLIQGRDLYETLKEECNKNNSYKSRLQRSMNALSSFLPIILGIGHGVLPIIWRAVTTHQAGTTLNPKEVAVTVLWFIAVAPATYFFCQLAQRMGHQFFAHARMFRALTAISSGTTAEARELPYFIDLADGSNIMGWLSFRNWLIQERLRLSGNYNALIAPTLAFALGVVISVFTRLALGKPITLVDALLFYNIALLSFYILFLLAGIVDCNIVLNADHLELLRKAQFRIARQLVAHVDREDDSEEQSLLFSPTSPFAHKSPPPLRSSPHNEMSPLSLHSNSSSNPKIVIPEGDDEESRFAGVHRYRAYLEILSKGERTILEQENAIRFFGLVVDQTFVYSVLSSLIAGTVSALFALVSPTSPKP